MDTHHQISLDWKTLTLAERFEQLSHFRNHRDEPRLAIFGDTQVNLAGVKINITPIHIGGFLFSKSPESKKSYQSPAVLRKSAASRLDCIDKMLELLV